MIRIGVDFDNTIVCYDTVFHRTAVEHGLVPSSCGTSKTEVRDFLRACGREDDWTALQGLAYGDGMMLAHAFDGALDFLLSPPEGAVVTIISHRTRRPYRGDADLHAAARDWIERNGLRVLLDGNAVFFEETRNAKFARISALACDLFIDDLPEFLSDPAFPSNVRRILFDPANLHPEASVYSRCRSWRQVAERASVR